MLRDKSRIGATCLLAVNDFLALWSSRQLFRQVQCGSSSSPPTSSYFSLLSCLRDHLWEYFFLREVVAVIDTEVGGHKTVIES